jgi:site-specific DNA-methyltransferase (adenine-specific)
MKIEIGNATLYLGDCMDILPTLDRVDAVITDPPYIVGAKGCGLAGDRVYLKEITDKKLDDGFDFSLLTNFENWMVFCGKQQLVELLNFAESQTGKWMLLTWNKTNPTPLTNNNYLPDTEYIVHLWQPNRLFGKYQDKSRFIVLPAGGGEFDHPTVKPLAIMNKCVSLTSKTNETILDPFMGSGTTGVAAVQMGRKFIGIEREPKYFDIACRRIEDAQKQLDMFAETITPVSVLEQTKLI